MGRDVVLAVGLVGICLGGLAVFVRTAAGAGGGIPVTPIVTVIVLVAGVALARWGLAPVRRRAPACPGTAYPATAYPQGPAYPPSADPPAVTSLLVAPAAAGPAAVAADVPEVGPGALDHAAVDADGFEHTIAALCARDGCLQVEVVGGAGDLGADVIATTADGLRVVVQCKHYGEGNRVGSQDLQRFGGTCFAVHEADVAVVVTTSSFTAPAREYAATCGIVCVDADDLAAWTESRMPPPWETAAPEPAQPQPPSDG
ncbi:restriction endonuclease [Streptomyces sp. NBC_00160]|uniref:restriction endonuclease n=1 Tax=Streptomyces sp. NBC_00160 TaxID=2903628 RepID=UPI00225046D8|nr:restriction endonuclease [Streptomyces sp. NBC_00160]MCX5309309.1 restriction endonuclease [Streptomyces sp. NBC_00160]